MTVPTRADVLDFLTQFYDEAEEGTDLEASVMVWLEKDREVDNETALKIVSDLDAYLYEINSQAFSSS